MSERIAWARSRKSETASRSPIGAQVVLGLAGDPERLATGRDQAKRRSRRQQLGERPGGLGEELLEIVEDDVGSLVADARCDRGGTVAGGAQSSGDQGHDKGRIADGGERHEDRAAVGLLGEEPGELDREAGLAGSAGADDREHARIAVEPERRSLEQLLLAAEERGCGRGEIDGARRSQRRELDGADLEQLHGSVEVLEPMTPEIPLRLILDESRRRGGDDDLAAVRECADPRTAVDVDPDVALRGRHREPPCAGPSAP